MRQLRMPVLAAAVAAVLATTPAHADIGDQLFKLLPDDGAAIDFFGASVAISGSTTIIGAVWDDDNGTDSGSAYIFDTKTGKQLFKLLPNDGAAEFGFGFPIKIGGPPGKQVAIIGASLNDKLSGSAYLFDITTGQQIIKFIAQDGEANDRFGGAFAIRGNIAIIGAWLDDDNGLQSGSAYIFDTTTGQQITKFMPEDGQEYNRFGHSIAISGNTAIIGAPIDDNGSNSGSAYLFDISDPSNPIQTAKLLPDDKALYVDFGQSVAIFGTTAIVGSNGDNDKGIFTGSALLFEISDPRHPVQMAKLLASDGSASDRFGFSLAISGTTAIIGAWQDDDYGFRSGSAYLFDISDPVDPTQIAKLMPNDGAADDWFGYSVAISGAPGNKIAIAGAHGDDDNGESSGSAYLFDASTTPGNCPWDLDNSGSVGTSDLLELFAQWGTDGSADFDDSGTVDTADLLILFANWGPCK